MRPWSLVLALGVVLSGCASYTSNTRGGLEAFERRDFTKAEDVYHEGAEKEGVDQLVYLFDRGTVRNLAGQYEQSLKDFLAADKLAEIKDYTAIGTEVASVFTNDRIIQYKGEEFETVLISVYLALDFAALQRDEDAIVACRRVNRKLELLRDEGKRDYRLNGFAQYLAGLLFERQRNWNFAYVDYKKTKELNPEFSPLKMDLVRGALKMDSSSDLHKWKKTLGVTDAEVKEAATSLRQTGAVVLLYQNGFAPEKIVSPHWHEIPEYRSRFNRHQAAHLYLDGKKVARTEILYDVEAAAFENLRQKYAAIIAKRLGGVVAREVIGNKIDEKQAGLGTLFKIGMMVASQPDLRSWLTLPKNFQVARVQVKPGKYHATLRLENTQGVEEAEKDLGEVEVRRVGDISLLNYRSMND
ncbi:MAG: hypothetical protein AB7K68_00260 [Bacteriovoracia bacterium]